MCGIAGVVSIDGTGEGWGEGTEQMLALLAHRGPDATGTWRFEGGAFGHVRLAVVDPRPESNQPFLSSDGTIGLTCNAEIFNYVELRAELEARGHTFRTASDTEVILAAYQEWDLGCFERFNGMWALAIHDTRRDRLVLCRDRFGMKPLYHATVAGQLYFASEAKAILKRQPGLARPNYRSLSNLLRESGGCGPGKSFFEGIERLEPATCLVLDGRTRRSSVRYWRYPAELGHVEPVDAAGGLWDLLVDATRIRTRSDVPVGVTLSGGLDSGTILSILARLGGAGIDAYTAAFPGHQDDESPRAQALAQAVGARFHPVEWPPWSLLPVLDRVVWHLDSPTCSPAVLPLWFVVAEARRNRTIVLLEGQGADEALGGYEPITFPSIAMDRVRARDLTGLTTEFREHVRIWGAGNTAGWLTRAAVPSLAGLWRRWRGDEQVYRGPLEGLGVSRGPVPDPRGPDRLWRCLWRQHTGTLRDLLHYGDKVSMAWSVESRLPFLDHRVVEFLFRLPGKVKTRGGEGKRLLRKAIEGRVPPLLLDPRKKLGFETPIARWIRDGMARDVRPFLLDRQTAQRGLFDVRAMERGLRSHERGEKDLSIVIFRWLTVESWFRSFLDAPGALAPPPR